MCCGKCVCKWSVRDLYLGREFGKSPRGKLRRTCDKLHQSSKLFLSKTSHNRPKPLQSLNKKKKPYELKLELKNTLATISTPFGPLHFHPSISLSGPFISSRKLRAILQTSTTSRQNYETKRLWAVKEIINILKILRIGNPSSWFPLLLIGLEHSSCTLSTSKMQD